MMLRIRRLLPLFLVILFFCCAFVLAEEPAQQILNSDTPPDDRTTDSWHDGPQKDIPGVHAVEEAVIILRDIKPSVSRLSKFNKPTGMLGIALYYAKELFVLLFMNKPTQPDLITTNPQPKKLSAPLLKAVGLLEDAAEENNPDAIHLLAEMNFYGNWTHPRNYSEAFRRYHQLADLNGNASSQHMIGFMYATGLGGAVKQDQARATLYYKIAAEGGDIRSEMASAYRHHIGISVPKSCEESSYYYKKVADKAIAWIRSGPPGGYTIYKEAYRIADDDGGIYGEGASVSSAGQNAKQGGPNSDAYAALDDVLEYLDLMSRKGDLKAMFNLGRLHYDGTRSMKKNLHLAKLRFLDVARSYWAKDGKIKTDVQPGTEKLASKAAGYLGRMFMRGEGMEQSFSIAQTWFKRGVANGDSLCQYQLGLMHLHGLGMPKDPVKASEYFGAAADQDLAAAQVRLGALFLDQGDVQTATKYFDLAARNGHIESYYYLAELARQGIGRDKSCWMASMYYKIVAEKAEFILASFKEANDAYEAGEFETALVDYMLAAEQGFEIGQANVAYLLDQAKPRFALVQLLGIARQKASLATDAALALIYWTRSAKQHNIDSIVKMGDYYLEGLGTDPDAEKAAACYQAAAETMQSAQAMWNLGWMHENGIGMEQDFHLAKRMYDQALETNNEAYLPVRLALLKLRARSWWNDVTNGRVKSIQDDDEPRKSLTLSEWLVAFLEADAEAAYHEQYYEPDDYDGDHTPVNDMPGGDDFYDEIDEGIIESLVIVSLAALFAFLLFYRQQWQLGMQRRREEERRRREQGGNGQGDVQVDENADQAG